MLAAGTEELVGRITNVDISKMKRRLFPVILHLATGEIADGLDLHASITMMPVIPRLSCSPVLIVEPTQLEQIFDYPHFQPI